MRAFELGKYRKARVWLNDLPAASFTPSSETRSVLTVTEAAAHGMRMAAIELFVPVGPRAMYGLLGARFEANQSAVLVIEVGSTAPTGAVLPDSLAMQGDTVRVGLPAEYIAGVTKGIELAHDDLAKLGSGVLRLNCAAFAEISSCQAIYTQVFQMLASVLAAGRSDMTDEDLLAAIMKPVS